MMEIFVTYFTAKCYRKNWINLGDAQFCLDKNLNYKESIKLRCKRIFKYWHIITYITNYQYIYHIYCPNASLILFAVLTVLLEVRTLKSCNQFPVWKFLSILSIPSLLLFILISGLIQLHLISCINY